MATATSTHATTYTTQPCHDDEQPATADTTPKQKLALDQLAVVRFVSQITLVQTVTAWSKAKWGEGRKLWYLWWLLASAEMVLISFWILIHSLPWPDWALEYLHRVDEVIVKGLEWTQGKIEWYWHPDSRLKSIVLWIRRWLLQTIGLVRLPLKVLSTLWMSTRESAEESARVKAEEPEVRQPRSVVERKRETKSEGEVDEGDEEFWGDEECLSDTSEVSNLSETTSFIHQDGKGRSVTCVRKTATAEGRLRTIMERRVNVQLKLMRKNSIRFSKGILNYAEVLFGPRVQTWSSALVRGCSSWAQEHELDEMVRAIRDEVLSRPYLCRPFAFFWAITFNSVMFFFRLLMGKKNKRPRLSRKESFRRRQAAKPATPETPILPTTPGLQMSSEPTVDASTPSSSFYASSSSSGTPPCEREETFEGIQKKEGLDKVQEGTLDSGVEGDETHSEEAESDRVCSTILEEDERYAEEVREYAYDKNTSAEENESPLTKEDEDGTQSPLSSSPTSVSLLSDLSKTKKKILRTNKNVDNTARDSKAIPSRPRKRVTIR